MRPAEFENATEEDFKRDFYIPLRSGRVPGETLDMQIIYPLSQKYRYSDVKESPLKEVVDHMLSQIE